jgi:hypothetical protein
MKEREKMVTVTITTVLVAKESALTEALKGKRFTRNDFENCAPLFKEFSKTIGVPEEHLGEPSPKLPLRSFEEDHSCYGEGQSYH